MSTSQLISALQTVLPDLTIIHIEDDSSTDTTTPRTPTEYSKTISLHPASDLSSQGFNRYLDNIMSAPGSTMASPTVVWGNNILDEDETTIPALPIPPYPSSPGSIGNVLAAYPQLDTNILRGMVESLVQTCRLRESNWNSDITNARIQIGSLQNQLEKYTETLDIAPEGYEYNYRLPNFTIPAPGGYYHCAAFIKRLGNGQVAGLSCEDTARSEPHIINVYAAPIFDQDKPIEDLPPWFRHLIIGPSTQFHMLEEEAAKEDNWGLLADITRCRGYDDQMSSIQVKIDALRADM
jgi:hypothetical protein